MSVTGNIQLGFNNKAWFNANPTKILKNGQHVYLTDGADEFESAYCIGDGVTALSLLPWKGVNYGAQTFQQVLINGNTMGGTPIVSDNLFTQFYVDDNEAALYYDELSTGGNFATVLAGNSGFNLQAQYSTGEKAIIYSQSSNLFIQHDLDINLSAINTIVDGVLKNNTILTPLNPEDYIQKGHADATYQPVGSYLSGTIGTNQIAVGGVSGLVGSGLLTFDGDAVGIKGSMLGVDSSGNSYQTFANGIMNVYNQNFTQLLGRIDVSEAKFTGGLRVIGNKSYLGGSGSATSTLDLASLSNAAQLRIIGNSSVVLSSNGEIGYDLTHAYIRIGSTNYQLDQQVTNASVLAAIGYTPTQSVSGTTNRITSTGGTTPVIDISATFEALLGKVANPLSQFAATTSAQLAGVISDETGGAGVAVFNSNPTLLGATFTTNALTVTDVNVVLGTTTGTKFGTATTQKLGFYNATPIVQVGATIDLGLVLSNLGLRAAGTAYTITTSGAVAISGASTFSSATNTIFNNQNVQIGTVGKGLAVKEGVNGRSGAATMVAGTITISNTTITTNSRIFITPIGNTNAGKLDVTIVAATSFTIRSDSPTDTRVVNYFIVEGN